MEVKLTGKFSSMEELNVELDYHRCSINDISWLARLEANELKRTGTERLSRFVWVL